MSQAVSITIQAKDGTSQTFRAIASSAKSTATSVEEIGKKGSDGLGKLDSAAGKSATSLGKLDGAAGKSADAFKTLGGAVAGLAGSALVGFLSDSARAAAEAEASAARLAQSFENAGTSVDAYARQLDAAGQAAVQMGYDDDDAADAIANLTNITGDAAQSIDLLGVAMDLSRAKGISLADASTIVGKVAEGNIGILGRYGIAVQEGASAQEALAAVQERFAGQAEAYASTTAGSIDRIRVAFGNFQEQIGGLAGPLQAVLGVLPGISGGFSMLSGAIGAVSAAGGFGGLATQAGAFLVALGPVGLAVGALVVGLGALTVALATNSEATKVAKAAYAELDTVLTGLGVDQATQSLIDAGLNVTDYADRVYTQVSGMIGQTAEINGQMVLMTGDLAEAYRLSADEITVASGSISRAIALTGDQALDTAKAFIDGILPAYGSLKITGDDLLQIGADVTAIFEAQGDAAEANQAKANALFDVYNRGDLLTADLVDQIRGLRTEIDMTTKAIPAQAAAMDAQTQAYRAQYGALGEYMSAEASRVVLGQSAIKQAMDQKAATDGLTEGINTQWRAMNAQADAQNTQVQLSKEQQAAQDALAATLRGQLVPALDGAAAGMDAVALPGENIVDVFARIDVAAGTLGHSVIAVADSVSDAMTGMESVLSIFSALDQIGNASQNATDIAQKIVGDPGVYAEVDNLLAAGLITLKQYNDLQEDEVQIVADNAAVQQDLNLVRANSIPLLAEQEGNLRKSADALAALSVTNPELAQQALYLQDAGNQAKVAAVYATEYAMATNQIPTEVGTKLIVNAAEADPVLADFLESAGMIERDPITGKITLNDVEAKASFDTIQGSIDHLNNTLIDIAIATNGPNAELELRRVKENVDEIPDSKSTTITADDQASQPAANVKGAVEEIPGTVRIDVMADDAASDPLANVKMGVEAIPTTKTTNISANDDATEPIRTVQGALDDLPASVTIPVEIDYSNGGAGAAANDLYANGGNAPAQTVTVDVVADTSGFTSSLNDVQAAGGQLDGTTYTPEIAGDPALWQGTFDAVNAQGTSLDTTVFTPEVAGDPAQWQATFDAVTAQGTSLDTTTYVPDLSGDDSLWQTIYTNVTNQGVTFDGTTYTAGLDGDTAAFYAAVRDIPEVVGTRYVELDAVDRTGDVNGGMLGRTVLPAMAGGGTVWADLPVPKAAGGRVTLVGEAGPELALLPYGTQVVPTGASGTRMETMAREGGMRFYGPVHIHAQSADIAAEISRQMLTRSRA